MSQIIRLQFYDTNGESVHNQVLNLFDYLKNLQTPEETDEDNITNNNVQLFIATQQTSEFKEEQINYTCQNDFIIDQVFPLSIGSFFLINDKKLPNIYTFHIIAYEDKYLRYYSCNYLGYLVNNLLSLLTSSNTISKNNAINDSHLTLEVYLKNKYKAVDAYLPVALRLVETSNFIKCFDQHKYTIRLI